MDTVFFTPEASDGAVFMSPDKYLALTPTMKDADAGAQAKALRESMAKGEPIHTAPSLTIEDGKVTGQDGRHRAQAAKDAGIKKIPVKVKGDLPAKVTGMRGDTHDVSDAKPAIHWADITAQDAYKKMSYEDKEAARNAFFDKHIAPRAPAGELDAVREAFDAKTRIAVPPTQAKPQAAQPDWKAQIPADVKQKLDRSFDNGSMVDAMEGVGNVVAKGLATPVAGLAGLGTMGLNSLGITRADPASVIGRITGYFDSKTPAGRATENAITLPFQALASGAGWVGNKTLSATGSPAAATAVDTAIQALPMVFGARAAAKTRGQTLDPNVMAAQRMHEAEARAQQSSANAGIDWSALPGAVRNRLTELAQDATSFGNLDATALRRIAQAESLPVPIKLTRGQATRDPVQLRVEDQTAATEQGRALSDRHAEQNDALTANLQRIQDRARAKNPRDYDAGNSVFEVLSKQAKSSEGKVNFLYDKARQSPEANKPIVDTRKIVDWLNETPRIEAVGAIAAKLKRLGVIAEKDGKYEQARADRTLTKSLGMNADDIEVFRNLTPVQAESVRSLAVKLGKAPDATGHFMSEAKRVLDESTSELGGEPYQKARNARIQHAKTFEDPGAISDVLEMKSRTDRKLPFEDIWRKKVMNASVDDLTRLKEQLLTGDAATRNGGKAAWRNIQSQTVEFIKERAANSITSPTKTGSAEFSPSGLKRALDQIGDDHLGLIFSKETVRQLHQLDAVSRDVKSHPTTVKGSPTSANLMVMLDRILGHVPMVGPIGRGAIRVGGRLKQEGDAAAQAERLANQDITDMPGTPRRPVSNQLLRLQGKVPVQMFEMGNENRRDQP